jgi:hypothetical protein
VGLCKADNSGEIYFDHLSNCDPTRRKFLHYTQNYSGTVTGIECTVILNTLSGIRQSNRSLESK